MHIPEITQLNELQEEFAAEREELMDHLRALTKEIRLRDVVLESFVPLSALQLIEERAQWYDVCCLFDFIDV